MCTQDGKVTQEEKLAAANFLQDAARVLSVQEFPAGRLVVWVNENSLPSIRCCTFRSLAEGTCVPNSSLDEFIRVLAEARPELENLEVICDFFEKASPQARRVLRNLPVWMKDLGEVWHPPQFDEQTFSAFFENSTDGQVEKISLDSNYGVDIKFIKKGPQLTLR